jgi:hypothetical protein
MYQMHGNTAKSEFVMTTILITIVNLLYDDTGLSHNYLLFLTISIRFIGQ